MSFLRNPEIKRSFLVYFLLTIIFTCIGFFIGYLYGISFLCLCLAYDIAHFAATYGRYKKIKALSCEIDKILHGKESIDLSEYAEGELSILQSEISKMTIKLHEQAENLQHDKTYLADSIADISHQIRTPLTSINLIVSFLSEPSISGERRTELTQELFFLLSRIDWLISSLLKISKLDAGTAFFKNETVSVSELLKKASEPITIPIELRFQQLIFNINGFDTFNGDLSWSIEAISNILKNCMEHTPEGGIIHVNTSKNAIYTEITIKDNGSGIDSEDLPHIFERFYKGKNSSDASVGIGLALARMIITKQNGTIKAENNKDGGALFTIRFYNKET